MRIFFVCFMLFTSVGACGAAEVILKSMQRLNGMVEIVNAKNIRVTTEEKTIRMNINMIDALTLDSNESHLLELSNLIKEQNAQATKKEQEMIALVKEKKRVINNKNRSDRMNSNKKVDFYYTMSCPYCVKMRNFLIKNRINYTGHDVNTDRKARQKCKQLGCRGVPVLLIDNKYKVCGYNPDKVLKMLQK